MLIFALFKRAYVQSLAQSLFKKRANVHLLAQLLFQKEQKIHCSLYCLFNPLEATSSYKYVFAIPNLNICMICIPSFRNKKKFGFIFITANLAADFMDNV